MDAIERRQYISELREANAQRSEEVRADSSARLEGAPAPDPMIEWRRASEEKARQRAAARAEMARAARPAPPTIDWRAVDARIQNFIAAEREFVLEVVAEALAEGVDQDVRRIRDDVHELRGAVANLQRDLDRARQALDGARDASRSEDGRLRAAIDSTREAGVVLRQRVGDIERDVDRALARRVNEKLGERLDTIVENVVELRNR
jgi:hypothetical protein